MKDLKDRTDEEKEFHLKEVERLINAQDFDAAGEYIIKNYPPRWIAASVAISLYYTGRVDFADEEEVEHEMPRLQ